MANPVTWFEIIGKDAAKLRTFYSEVFDWQIAPPMGPETGHYCLVDHKGEGIGGGIGQSDQPTRVSVYIQVADPQAALDKAVKHGATMVMPVMEVMQGVTIALFTDPDGNTMGLLKAM